MPLRATGRDLSNCCETAPENIPYQKEDNIYHTKRKVGRFPFPPWLSGAFAEKNFGGVVGWFVR